MFRKLCVIALLSFMIVSCGSDETDSTTPSGDTSSQKGLSIFENDSFSIGIPSAWNTMQDTATLLPKPYNGDIELASSSPDSQNGFSNNILILSQTLNTPASSKDFSLLNHIGVQKEYSEYVKLDAREIVFLSGDTSMLYVFEAKYNLDTPKLKFIQTAGVCNSTQAYFITIALPASLKDTSRYESILETFTCK